MSNALVKERAHSDERVDNSLGTTLSLLAIYILWGANFLFVDIAVRDLSPAITMGARFTLAGVLLLPVARRFGSKSPDKRRAWREAIGTAIPLFVGGSGLLAWGLVYLESGVGAVLLATIPGWLVILELILRRSMIALRTFLGLVGGIIGVALVVRPDVANPVDPFGAFLVLAAALSWAAGSHRSRATTSIHLLERTAMQMTAGGLMLLAIGIGLWALGHPVGVLTVEASTAVGWLVVVSSIIGFTAYTHALKHASITAIAAYPNANTLFAIILGVILLNETLSLSRAIGAGLILIAVRLLTTHRETTKSMAQA
jgi:drug/metabolite transporter (DMT)-like permease